MKRYKVEVIQDGVAEPIISAEYNCNNHQEAEAFARVLMDQAKVSTSKPYSPSIALIRE